jgi:hypothetical protein
MVRKVTVLILTAALTLGSIPGSRAFAQQSPVAGANALAVPVAGAVTGLITGNLTGTATITDFAVQNGQLVATGLLTGAITNASGTVQSVAATFQTPVDTTQTQAVCEILNLVLGPIHLDLLGLVIDTNQIMVGITAVQGAGNLLGNLLCAVTGLLDGGGALQQVADLLNRILTLLA